MRNKEQTKKKNERNTINHKNVFSQRNDYDLISYTKANTEWFTYQSVRAKTTKLLE